MYQKALTALWLSWVLFLSGCVIQAYTGLPYEVGVVVTGCVLLVAYAIRYWRLHTKYEKGLL